MSRTFKNATRSWMAVVAALGTMVVAAPGAAAPPQETVAISIDYTDLDLSTAAGVNALYRRIVAASRRVCPGMPPGFVTVSLRNTVRTCREAAVEGAVAQIGSSRLAAVHAEQQSRG
jgi:UrcA family protein